MRIFILIVVSVLLKLITYANAAGLSYEETIKYLESNACRIESSLEFRSVYFRFPEKCVVAIYDDLSGVKLDTNKIGYSAPNVGCILNLRDIDMQKSYVKENAIVFYPKNNKKILSRYYFPKSGYDTPDFAEQCNSNFDTTDRAKRIARALSHLATFCGNTGKIKEGLEDPFAK